MNLQKEAILKNLLNQVLNKRLLDLERVSKEHINSLESASKTYKDLDKIISSLSTNIISPRNKNKDQIIVKEQKEPKECKEQKEIKDQKPKSKNKPSLQFKQKPSFFYHTKNVTTANSFIDLSKKAKTPLKCKSPQSKKNHAINYYNNFNNSKFLNKSITAKSSNTPRNSITSSNVSTITNRSSYKPPNSHMSNYHTYKNTNTKILKCKSFSEYYREDSSNTNESFNKNDNLFLPSASNNNLNNTFRKSYFKSKSQISDKRKTDTHTKYDFQSELFNIQEQIKYVNSTISNTEKALEHRRFSSSNSDRYVKNNKGTVLYNTEPTFKKMFSLGNYLFCPNSEANQINCETNQPNLDKLIIDGENNNLKNAKINESSNIISNILKFCSTLDAINFLTSSKKYFKEAHKNYLINLLNDKNSDIDNQISSFKSKYSEKELNEEYTKFALTRGSIKAIELLNQDLYIKIFTREENTPTNEEIIIIYKIFYQLIKNEELVNIKDNKLFWKKNCNFMMNENNNKQVGNYVLELCNKFVFSIENIYVLKNMIMKIQDKISPSYYSKICGTTGLFIFIIKDALEYCGAFYSNKKTQARRIYDLLLYEKEYVVKKLNDFIENIENM